MFSRFQMESVLDFWIVTDRFSDSLEIFNTELRAKVRTFELNTRWFRN